ncbi:hypothetical protein QFC21_004350 [Naganishia friedmannii]|uniref:Uncharacterized protein n=1 Tax=Naganishia friedmannii TaxID=89922 RepID=A0ACC2VJH5_9TREE|nr:hypothetical protein QFC21_004350 [Naganishia friedmannii]
MDPDTTPASLRTTQQGEAVRKRARSDDADGHHGDDGDGNGNPGDDGSRGPQQQHYSSNNGSWSFPPPHGLATPAHKQSMVGTPTSAVAAMALATPAPNSQDQQQPSSALQVPGTSSEQKKRRRTSPEELKILEDAYLVNTLPSSEDRTRLAERTGMTPRAVQIWFQNKRQTEKRKLTQSMYPNVMIIPIHRHGHSTDHPVPGSITPGGTPIGMPSGAAASATAAAGGTPSTTTWTTYHPHRASHAHPGAPALGPATMAYGTPQGYYVQSNAALAGGRPQPPQATAQQQPPPGYFPVLPPPGMMAYPHPHPHALHHPAHPPAMGFKTEAEQNAARQGDGKDSVPAAEGNTGIEDANNGEEGKPFDEPLNTVTASDIRQGNPSSATPAGATPQPQGHPHPHTAPAWPYYTPGHPYAAYPYPPPQGLNAGPPGTPTPGQGQAQGYPPLPPHLREYYMHPGQHVQAPHYPYAPPPPGTYAYPAPPHLSQQGQAVPVPFGYPSPYHLQYAYGAPSSAPPAMMAPPQSSAGANNAPVGSYPAVAGVGAPAEKGTNTPTPVTGANVGSAAATTSGERGTMAYSYAPSSERDNTGHVQRHGLSDSQATGDAGDNHVEEEEVDEEVEEEEDDDDETNGQAGMRRQVGSSPTPAQHTKTTTTTTMTASSSSSSSGGAVDFHRRNSGEATRAGFRMINGDSSAFAGLESASRGGPRRMMVDDGVVVKQEEDELEESDAEGGAALVQEHDNVDEGRSGTTKDHNLLLSDKKPLLSALTASSQPANNRTLPSAANATNNTSNEKRSQSRIPQPRPRSSMGFHHPSEISPAAPATTSSSLASRGILDEMCAMRELPYKRSNGTTSTSGAMVAGERDEMMPLVAPLSSSSPMLSCDSGIGGVDGLPSSDPDPFGSTTIAIPIPYVRSRGGQGYAGRKSEGKAYRRASPPVNRLGGGGRAQQRRPATTRPSRSPDIFDRMSSDPPSGGLEELCADDDADADARRMMMDVSGGLSDTDQEDDHSRAQSQHRASSKSMASSSGASGEYGPSSASTMILATPIKTEYDHLTGRGIAATTSEAGGRKLRFVPSSATSSGNGRKRKLELTEDDDKENSHQSRAVGSAKMIMGITSTSGKPRPVLGRVASLDFYAGSPAKRSSSLGAEARRLSEVVSKYAKTSTPPTSTMSIGSHTSLARGGSQRSAKSGGSADRDRRHALGALEGHRKLNGSSSLSHSYGKASRLSSRGEKTTAGVARSFSTGQLALGAEEGKYRATTESLTSGRTDDEECARLLLGLGSSR